MLEGNLESGTIRRDTINSMRCVNVERNIPELLTN